MPPPKAVSALSKPTLRRNNAAPRSSTIHGAGKSLRLRAVIFTLRRLGGEMAEWFKAHAWKACVAKTHRGFESLSLRHLSLFSFP